MVLARVVLHAVVGHLLRQSVFVLQHKLLDHCKSFLLVLEVGGQLVRSRELVLDVVLHFVDAL